MSVYTAHLGATIDLTEARFYFADYIHTHLRTQDPEAILQNPQLENAFFFEITSYGATPKYVRLHMPVALCLSAKVADPVCPIVSACCDAEQDTLLRHIVATRVLRLGVSVLAVWDGVRSAHCRQHVAQICRATRNPR